jgi:hypothetical protein
MPLFNLTHIYTLHTELDHAMNDMTSVERACILNDNDDYVMAKVCVCVYALRENEQIPSDKCFRSTNCRTYLTTK